MRTLRHLVRVVLLGALFSAVALAAEESRKTYDIRAGDAAAALKQFSATSGRETLFAAEAVRGVKTPAVKGELTVQEALDALLTGTGLIATIDEKTGAIAVRREIPDESKNGSSRHAEATTAGNGTGQADAKGGPVRLDDYLVVGLRAPGPVNEGAIPRTANHAVAFQVFDRLAIEGSGANSLGEFFRSYGGNTSPGLGFQQIFAASATLATGPGDTSDRINLRGLGDSRTVVLLNGRRLFGSDTNGPDVSRIPLSSVERVEILTGAAAAIFGANAVGGAINIITRRNYERTEVTGYFGTSTRGGGGEWRGTLYSGFSLNEGRTAGSIIVEHGERKELRASQREFYLEALNQVAPDDPLYRTVVDGMFNTPRAAIIAMDPIGLQLPSNPSATVAAVPTGYNSPTIASVVPNDFNGTVGQQALGFRRIGAVQLQPSATIDSINFQGEHQFFKDRLEAYTELAWRYQVGRNEIPGLGGNLFLSAFSPNNPFRANPAAGRPVGTTIMVVWDPVDLPFDSSYTLQRTSRVVGGLKGKLGREKKWAWALDYSFDRNESYSRYLQFSSSLNDAITAGLYNPFRDLAQFPNTIDVAPLTQTNVARNIPEVHVGNLRFSGELFTWRAGSVRASWGAELRREQQQGVSVTDFSAIRRAINPFVVSILTPLFNGESRGSREARSVYAEMTIPVFGEKLTVPGVEAIEVSLAARRESYDRYSYVSTFNTGIASAEQPGAISGTPITAAMLWRPTRDVSFRVSYSNTFVSPTMTDLFSARYFLQNSVPVTFYDPVFNATVVRPVGSVEATSGGNVNLLPERGRSYNYGVIVTPRWIEGLTLSADLFHVVSDNQIYTPDLQTIISYFPGRVTRDSAGNVTAYDTSAINMSQVVVGGADLRLDWQRELGTLGRLTWQANATYTDYYKQQAVTGTPFLSGVADQSLGSSPLRWKGSAGLIFARNQWSAGVTVRYTGKFKGFFNPGRAVPSSLPPIDGEFIRAQVETDVRLSYNFPRTETGWRRFLSGTRATIGALNVFDRRPPYVTYPGGPYYSYYNDPRMRFIYLEVRKQL